MSHESSERPKPQEYLIYIVIPIIVSFLVVRFVLSPFLFDTFDNPALFVLALYGASAAVPYALGDALLKKKYTDHFSD